MATQTLMWLAFFVLVLVMLAVDLGFNRKQHEVSFREALSWTVFWIALALFFNAGIYWWLGSDKAMEFLTGYVIEKSLSVDNLFVFIMIFAYFRIAGADQPKILKWGIIGALVMRAIFIFAGIGLLEAFHWMIYVFGGIIIITGIKMARGGDEEVDPEKNLLIRVARRVIPVTKRMYGGRFFVRRGNLIAATPLFLALLMVESSDLIFAVDSIPAIFAVSRDPFIVYTSNVFAILGLRSLYFLIASVLTMFVYLKTGISAILVFVGVKMLLIGTPFQIPTPVSLAVICSVLLASVAASVLWGKREAVPEAE